MKSRDFGIPIAILRHLPIVPPPQLLRPIIPSFMPFIPPSVRVRTIVPRRGREFIDTGKSNPRAVTRGASSEERTRASAPGSVGSGRPPAPTASISRAAAATTTIAAAAAAAAANDSSIPRAFARPPPEQRQQRRRRYRLLAARIMRA
jgi:hypothetical protein